MIIKLLTEHHLELLSSKGCCTGSSESTLVEMPHCWISHVVAQLWYGPGTRSFQPPVDCETATKGYFHLCPCMDFLQTLHINNSLYTNYENVFIEIDS